MGGLGVGTSSVTAPVYICRYHPFTDLYSFFAFSQGALIWVFIAEIIPNQVRAKGQTLGSLTHWVRAALIAFLFPILAEQVGGGTTFLFFSIMMLLQLLFVWKLMPETKGRTLEQMDRALVMH
jgi:hypothetical protein